jgi:hypothetical protein
MATWPLLPVSKLATTNRKLKVPSQVEIIVLPSCFTTASNYFSNHRCYMAFNGRLISAGTQISFPLRSCDLTVLDFFVWPYLKNSVFRKPVNSPGTYKTNSFKKSKSQTTHHKFYKMCLMHWNGGFKFVFKRVTITFNICY